MPDQHASWPASAAPAPFGAPEGQCPAQQQGTGSPGWQRGRRRSGTVSASTAAGRSGRMLALNAPARQWIITSRRLRSAAPAPQGSLPGFPQDSLPATLSGARTLLECAGQVVHQLHRRVLPKEARRIQARRRQICPAHQQRARARPRQRLCAGAGSGSVQAQSPASPQPCKGELCPGVCARDASRAR